ncbi:BT_3044 domain-containing protein [Gaoshiqia sp. Z1-71]|uniref:BT_3044 domain-containing protein n=1 Tax=Gaoshiqia hydrogeniformans TaxID=3290090 RepID=UPI003BF8A814
MMRKIALICSAVFLLALPYSCHDELDDELFEKVVLLTKNGWIDQELYLNESGRIDIPVVVSVNGTSGNNIPVDVQVRLAPDTLSNYNFEKYRNQTGLYYEQPEEDALAFKDETIRIPAGELYGVSSLTLDLDKLSDRYADYVIPLEIASTSAYKTAAAGYSKALVHLVFKNSFSGNYSGEIAVYKTKADGSNDTGNRLTVAVKSLYALSGRQCYFYAGQFDRSSIDRDQFIVDLDLSEDNGVSLSSPNAGINLIMEEGSVEVSTVDHTTDNRYMIVTTTLKLKYTFIDVSSSDQPVLRAEGTISMNQQALKEPF